MSDPEVPEALSLANDALAEAVIAMLADWVPVRTIAKKSGLSPETIRSLRDCTWGQIKLKAIWKQRAAEYVNSASAARTVIQASLLPAAMELHQQMRSGKTSTRRAASQQLLDRGGLPRTQRIEEAMSLRELDLSKLSPEKRMALLEILGEIGVK